MDCAAGTLYVFVSGIAKVLHFARVDRIRALLREPVQMEGEGEVAGYSAVLEACHCLQREIRQPLIQA